jgi:PAS domain-containing protein
MVHQPLLMLDTELKVRNANPAFLQSFEVEAARIIGKVFYQMGDGQWDHPHLRNLLEEVLPRNKFVKDFVVDGHFPKVGVRKLRLNASRFFEEGKGMPLILLAIEEVK